MKHNLATHVTVQHNIFLKKCILLFSLVSQDKRSSFLFFYDVYSISGITRTFTSNKNSYLIYVGHRYISKSSEIFDKLSTILKILQKLQMYQNFFHIQDIALNSSALLNYRFGFSIYGNIDDKKLTTQKFNFL